VLGWLVVVVCLDECLGVGNDVWMVSWVGVLVLGWLFGWMFVCWELGWMLGLGLISGTIKSLMQNK
jgi:uncharacterized membrane protein AbrB (regulator of aidB expression)